MAVCSMNETPLPLIVSAMITFGRSVTSFDRASAASRAWKSWPSHRSTCQPNASNLCSSCPRSLVAETGMSDWTLLWSTMTVISPNR